jgi:LysR family glycine cleavage system transcriptional activator
VWQQREILNAKQAHFAQWIEAEVDAYLRSTGRPTPPVGTGAAGFA